MSQRRVGGAVALAQQRVLDRRGRRGEPAARHAPRAGCPRRRRCARSARPRSSPSAPAAASDAHLAAAIVRFRKKWWLPATKRAARLAADRRERRRAARGSAGCRWPGCACAARRPCSAPWAASPKTSTGPRCSSSRASSRPERRRGRSAAARSTRRRRRRTTACGPGPRSSVENARAPLRSSSTTQTGIDGEQTPVIGPTWSCSLPGSSAISPRSSSRSASARSGAQPSNTAAASSARRCGSHTRSHSIGGPECSSSPSRRPGTTVARRRDRRPRAAPSPRSARPRRALAAATRSPCAPPQAASAARRARGSPPAGGRQSTSTTGAPCVAQRVGERRQPEVDGLDAVQDVAHARRPLVQWPPMAELDAAGRGGPDGARPAGQARPRG